jgi:hypothetical protein
MLSINYGLLTVLLNLCYLSLRYNVHSHRLNCSIFRLAKFGFPLDIRKITCIDDWGILIRINCVEMLGLASSIAVLYCVSQATRTLTPEESWHAYNRLDTEML